MWELGEALKKGYLLLLLKIEIHLQNIKTHIQYIYIYTHTHKYILGYFSFFIFKFYLVYC